MCNQHVDFWSSSDIAEDQRHLTMFFARGERTLRDCRGNLFHNFELVTNHLENRAVFCPSNQLAVCSTPGTRVFREEFFGS